MTITNEQKLERLRTSVALEIVAAEENERKRIAHALHDDLAQHLFLLSLELRALHGGVASPEWLRRVGRAEELVRQLNDRLRRTAASLRPLALDRLGLKEALGDLIAGWSLDFVIPVETDLDDLPRSLSPQADETLYRVTQEALNNIAKHSNASAVRIAARRSAQGLRLVIEDDGDGFDLAAKRDAPTGVGLAGMGKRLALAGGALTIRTEPGKGAVLQADIPI